MNKRDLKADLELCNKATPGPWEFERPWEFGPIYAGAIADALDEERDRANRELLNNFREGWPHAIERAIEAEELSRELLKALKFFFKCLSDKDLVEPEPSHWLSLELSLIATLCHKAEEVLGDERTESAMS